jgi:flagellar hook-associated protein 3 FlgL
MRVTFVTNYQKTIHHLNNRHSKIDRLTTAVTSGKTLQHADDDPSGWVEAMDLKQTMRKLEMYEENLEFAKGWSESASNALTQLEDLFVEAKDIAVREISADLPERHQAHITRLEEMIDDAINLANTEYRNRYVFGGTETSTAPFAINAGGGPSGEDVVVYSGNQDDVDVRIGENRLFTINQNGQESFNLDDSQDISIPAEADSNMLSKLIALKDAISARDIDAINQTSLDLDDSLAQLRNQGSVVGNQMVRFEQRMSAIAELDMQKQDRYAEVAEDDVVEVISKLRQSHVALQASLKATSMLDGLNLMQYV